MNVIVTGSSRGLGYDLAARFVREGHNVAITARSSEILVKRIEQLRQINADVEILGAIVELNDVHSINTFLDTVFKEWDRIDVLINNAGIYNEDRVSEDIADNLEVMLNNNLLSAVRIGPRIIENMKARKSGLIINVVSIAARNLRLEAASYSISKLAMKGYTDLLREELRPYGIKVTGIYPGAMNTTSWDGVPVNRDHLVQTNEVGEALMALIQTGYNAVTEEIVLNNLGPI